MKRSRSLPVGYLEDCRSAAVVMGDMWCFEPEAFVSLRRRYRGYAASTSESRDPGVPISGCCDPANQY